MVLDSPSPVVETESEHDRRRTRYIENLKNLAQLERGSFYPPEVQVRHWEEVVDADEIKQLVADRNRWFEFNHYSPNVLAFFKDEERGNVFLAPTFGGNPDYRNVSLFLLDMLAAGKDIAPWARYIGLLVTKGEWFERKDPTFTMDRGLVSPSPFVFENMVNGYGDPKYSREHKEAEMISEIACIVHEAVHIDQDRDLDWGGPNRVIVETSSLMYEYLVSPSKNQKFVEIKQSALKILENSENADLYDEAFLVGTLMIADEDGVLAGDSLESARVALINVWYRLEHLGRNDLQKIRSQFEKQALSTNDQILRSKIREFARKYPNISQQVPAIAWLITRKEQG